MPNEIAVIPPAAGSRLKQFDPTQAKSVIAKTDAVARFAEEMRNWPLLERAIDEKLDWQQNFVEWWRANVRPNNRPAKSNADRGYLSRQEAEQGTEITQQQVSRWATWLKRRDESFAKLVAAAKKRQFADGNDSMSVHYSSDTPEWATPQGLYDALNQEFHFDLDVCATAENAKCARFYSVADDGLTQEWSGRCWVNPPYGGVIAAWVRKARVSVSRGDGTIVVCLVPARVDTAWWWEDARYGEVRFLRGRLRFGNAEASAPFPSAVVIFGHSECTKYWEWQ